MHELRGDIGMFLINNRRWDPNNPYNSWYPDYRPELKPRTPLDNAKELLEFVKASNGDPDFIAALETFIKEEQERQELQHLTDVLDEEKSKAAEYEKQFKELMEKLRIKQWEQEEERHSF